MEENGGKGEIMSPPTGEVLDPGEYKRLAREQRKAEQAARYEEMENPSEVYVLAYKVLLMIVALMGAVLGFAWYTVGVMRESNETMAEALKDSHEREQALIDALGNVAIQSTEKGMGPEGWFLLAILAIGLFIWLARKATGG